MALIAIPVNSTAENGRTPFLAKTLEGLRRTVDFGKHRLFCIDNASTDPATFSLYSEYKDILSGVFQLGENIGTARAVNKAWQLRKPGEHCVKMDSDIFVHQTGWLDQMEECFAADSKLGIIGLKRPDLEESPHAPMGTWSHSVLKLLPRKHGDRWRVVEVVQHVIGSCQCYSSLLLDKIGYLVQWGQYALDDSLAAARCCAAGFYSAFLCNFDIDHVDPGGNEWTQWKVKHAMARLDMYFRLREEYLQGKRGFWHGPDEDLEVTEPLLPRSL